MAISGGPANTRIMAGVGIPATASEESGSHLSGVLKKDSSNIMSRDFCISAGDGHAKRQAELEVPIEDK
ncbi:hypothetical protein THAOC_07564 [Thalassiosira oceanica]|uniref:Uncharacterized protein n=1 Tax=Thalassiosira oceanica TaxID=159749 RepID=K0TK61_THAOC|nr:hypothetical protein THAOC_07564 [Thalassiosira oceanica]|eukprot:EJK71032.1 hypothetical protein THAOC_07564 [Thalassiosira oceanica]